jgi:hypothetical protein
MLLVVRLLLMLFVVILVTILVLMDGLPLLQVLAIAPVILGYHRLANGHVELVPSDQTTVRGCRQARDRIFRDLIQLRCNCRIAAHSDGENGTGVTVGLLWGLWTAMKERLTEE